MARGSTEPATHRALVAAARKVALRGKAGDVRAALGAPQEWQPEAWSAHREVGEIGYGALFLGNALAKLRLVVAVENPSDPDGDPIPASDEASGVPAEVAAAATAELRRLRASIGGQGEILRRMNLQLEVVGEGYLVGVGALEQGEDAKAVPWRGEAEQWSVRSRSEVAVRDEVGPEGSTARTYVRRDPKDEKGFPLDPDRDTIIRFWQPDAEWGELADSNLRHALPEVRHLQALNNQAMAIANSQMHAGILTVPNELSFGPADPTEGEGGDDAGADPFDEELDRSFAEPIEMPDALGTVRPMVIRGPAEYLKPDVLRLIRMARDIDSSLDARIELRLKRIFRTLNMPPEIIEGHMETTYANAEQVDQDLFDDHLDPRARLIVDTLTVGFLRPNLADAGTDPEMVSRLLVWYDPGALVRQPDVEGNADGALDRGAIGWQTYRRVKGYSEDDAPDPAELLAIVGLRRGILTAELTVYLLRQLAEEAGVELPDPAELQPGGGGAEAEAAALIELLGLGSGNGHGRPGVGPAVPLPITATARDTPAGSNPGAELVAIDRDLRARLTVAASAAMDRALERAGNRIRAKVASARDLTRRVAPRDVAATIGPGLTAQAGTADELFAGAWTTLERQFTEWGTLAQAEALEAASRIAGGFSVDQRAALAQRQAAELDEAWAWMRGALEALAAERLFDPAPGAPDIGEHDPTVSVPVGLVRQAIARAGGATGLITAAALTAATPGLITDGTGAWVALTDAGTRPAGGIATGETLRGAMRDEGVLIEAYRWVYGPGVRQTNFIPHMRLAGKVFRNFDDPVLANGSGWPPFAYYLPGDHRGCQCDIEPVLVPPSELGLPGQAPAVAEPVGERYPGGLSTKEAEDWMQQRWGLDAEGKRRAILLTGLPADVANKIAGTMHELLTAYPRIAERVRIFGSSAPVTKALKAQFPAYRIGNIRGNAYADAQRDLGWLRFSTSQAKRGDDLLAELARAVDTNWSPRGTGSIEGVIRHEFGHHVYYRAAWEAKEAGAYPQLLSEITETVNRAKVAGGYANGRAAIEGELCRYALKNNDELMAEAFAMVTSDPAGGSTLARELVELALRWAGV